MTSRKDWLVDFKDTTPTNIIIADGRSIKATGKGKVILSVKIGQEIRLTHLQEVLYVPDLDGNLLSVDKTTSYGNEVRFKNGTCSILNRRGKPIAFASRRDNMYLLNTVHVPDQAHLATGTGDYKIWHERLGHISSERLKKLTGMVDGLNVNDKTEIGLCKGCIHGKQHRTPLPTSGGTRAKESLELIHSNVCGPMSTNSISGSWYFVTFIDDKS
jgi:hypothetical protein